jgi:hypothetical protein
MMERSFVELVDCANGSVRFTGSFPVKVPVPSNSYSGRQLCIIWMEIGEQIEMLQDPMIFFFTGRSYPKVQNLYPWLVTSNPLCKLDG